MSFYSMVVGVVKLKSSVGCKTDRDLPIRDLHFSSCETQGDFRDTVNMSIKTKRKKKKIRKMNINVKM